MDNLKVISAITKTAKTGNPFKALEVESNGAVYKVNVFNNAPDFASIKEGSIIVGKLEQKGEYWNILFGGQSTRGGASGGFKTAQIEKVMEVKRQDISKFQDNKENSIKIASTIRMAVDIATSMTPEQWQGTTMQEEIRFWRSWLINEWDVNPKDTEPF